MEVKLLGLIGVQRDHIDTLLKFIKTIKKELLLVDKRINKSVTEEEQEETIEELIFYIDNLIRNEEQD